MLNIRPIFINAFAFGGSNMLMNLLLSHPEVCITSGETHKVFKGTNWNTVWGKIRRRLSCDYPVRLLTAQNVFSPQLLQPRRKIPLPVKNYIDRVLYYSRFKAMIETHNLYKFENVLYTREELNNCWLLTKSLGGLVYTVNMFREMYPDAVFFGLIRNGLAICEGAIRRGGTAERFARIYNSVVKKMFEYNTQMPNYHIVRYENMVTNPLEFIHQLYKHAELDIKQLKKIRLQSKPVIDYRGNHNLPKGKDRQLFWYNITNLHEHIKTNINENQIRRLSVVDKRRFLSIAGATMKKLGYITKTKLTRVQYIGI